MSARRLVAAIIVVSLVCCAWAVAQGVGIGQVKSCGVLVESPADAPEEQRPLSAGSPVLNESLLEARTGAATVSFEGGQTLEMMEGAQVSVGREKTSVDDEAGRRKVNLWSFNVKRGVAVVEAHDDKDNMTQMDAYPGKLKFGGTRVRVEVGYRGAIKLAKITLEEGSGVLELVASKGRLILPDQTIILTRIDEEKWIMTIKVLRGPIVYRRSDREVGMRCDTGMVLILDLTPGMVPKRWTLMLVSPAALGGGGRSGGLVSPEEAPPENGCPRDHYYYYYYYYEG